MEAVLYTVGHSTLSTDQFIELLQAHGIRILADVRAFPASRRLPHFNKINLEKSLNEAGINYIHLPELGGRRRFNPELPDYGWKNQSFAAYAQYLKTQEFQEAADKLSIIARENPTAIMCAEKLWWNCHRRMISDHFAAHAWTVKHIMERDKLVDHKVSDEYKGSQQRLFD
jgi:uncharacterized protein (DUF488 family)